MAFKNFNIYTILISGIFLIILGLLSIFAGNITFQYILIIAAVIIFINSLLSLINLLKKKKKDKTLSNKILSNIITMVFAIFVMFKVDLIITMITIIFGMYVFIHSILHLINLVIKVRFNMPEKLKTSILFLITFIFSLLLLFNPNANKYYAYIVIGLYLLFLGISFIIDYRIEKEGGHKSRKVRIMLPIILTAFIPRFLITSINKLLTSDKKVEFEEVKKNEKPDIEV